MTRFLSRFGADRSGATAIEYGLIAGAMAVAIVAAIGAVTPNLRNAFSAIANDFPTVP